MVGPLADNHRFRNGEKARPFDLWFSIPTSVTFLLLFNVFDLSTPVKIAYALITYLLYHLFITFIQVPIIAMPTLASPSAQNRVSISTFCSGGANLDTVISTLPVWPLVEIFGGLGPDDEIINEQRGFFGVAAILAVLIVAGSLLHYFTTGESAWMQFKDVRGSLLAPVVVGLLTHAYLVNRLSNCFP
ncbi:MFS transporter [Ruminococcaceae bacterium OttesenSCG-928-A11]|nr:MFS transporter [Ruminococcaceae bacterium OttesenSCG-928-A11]